MFVCEGIALRLAGIGGKEADLGWFYAEALFVLGPTLPKKTQSNPTATAYCLKLSGFSKKWTCRLGDYCFRPF